MAREKDEHDPTLGPKVTAVHVGGDSLVDRLVPHVKKIGVALLIIAAILSVFFTWRWWRNSKAEKATDQLARALEVGDKPVAGGFDLPMPGATPDEPKFKTHAERAQATLAALGKAGDVRDAASLYEAQQLVASGKLDEALARYRKLGAGTSVDAAVAREGVGVVLETKATAEKDPAKRQKLLEEALAAYRAVQPDDKGPRRDYALYHEARILEALGKTAEAVTQLKQALAVAPQSALRGIIEMKLSALGASSEGT